MDINVLRSIITVLALVSFIGICVWAYSKGARKGFDEAAMLPFTDEDSLAEHSAGQGTKENNNG